MGESLVDQVTQLWVKLTGRRVNLEEQLWLDGPVGDPDVIGERFFHRFAQRAGLVLDAESSSRGLIPSVTALDGTTFDSTRLHPSIVDFYQRTSEYSFEVEPKWRGGLRPFAVLISLLFSRRLRQLNVPLSAEDARGGATSEVLLVRRGSTHLFSAWIRSLGSTGNVLYAGAYSTTPIPGHKSPCVKVVFPLPNGSAIVVMRPECAEDGSLWLRSAGNSFGDPGFYFFVQTSQQGGVARYVRSFQETIHVYPGSGAEVLAHHEVKFFGVRFLTQKYRMRPVAPSAEGPIAH